MRLTAPLYEGDSLLRYGPGFGTGEAPAADATSAEPVPALDVAGIEARARAMRAAYVSALLNRLWTRIETWFEDGRRARDEAYLAQANSHADLEARMRRLERGALNSQI
jgi:hypothetical protein